MASSGEGSQGLKWGIIIGTIFVPLLGVIMGLVYMNDPSSTKKAIAKTWLKVGIGVMALYFIIWMLNDRP